MTKKEIDKRWLKKYEKAKEYYKEFGNLLVPLRYITDDNFNLGQWIGYQRKRYKKGLISNEEIKFLENLNIKWELKNVASQTSFPEMAIYFYFNKLFKNVETRFLLDSYEFDTFIRNHNIAIEYDGVVWHKNEEKNKIDIKKNKYCYENNIKIFRVREYGLDKISEKDFILNSKNNNLEEAILYLFKLCDIENVRIDLKNNSKEIYDLINTSNNWISKYKLVEEYYQLNKDIYIPAIFTYKNEDIGNWLHKQKQLKKNNLLSSDKIEKLNMLEIDWNPNKTKWNQYFYEVNKYYEKEGNIDIPDKFFQNGLNISCWLNNQRYLYRNGRLSKDKITKLERFNISWDKKDVNTDKWNNTYNLCKEYINIENKKIKKSTEYREVNIGEWVSNQKKKYNNYLKGKIVKKTGILTNEQILLLKEINLIKKE